jgi:predicted nucleic acid-binding Zn ribbon protein
MHSSFDEEKKLRGAVGWQRKPRPAGVGLGGEVQAYLKRRGKELEKNASLMDLWANALPVAIAQRCRPESIQAGTLRVEVESGPWMHELRMMTNELLEYFQEHCPRNKIRRIVLVPRREHNQEGEHERTNI